MTCYPDRRRWGRTLKQFFNSVNFSANVSQACIVQHQSAGLLLAFRALGVPSALWFWPRNHHRPVDLAALASGAGDADARTLVHQQVAAVAIGSDPLVQGLRKSGVPLREVFRSPLGVEVCDAIGEWFLHGMIHPVPCGHRLGLLLRNSTESRIGR